MKNSLDRQLAAIMFTDIQGYTALMQQNERAGFGMRNRHRQIFNSVTEKFGGKILQYYGDGTLSIFTSVLDAVKCGAEMQLAFQQNPQVPVRIGIHLGDIVLTEDDVVGDAVNVASRIESMGVVGSVLISDRVQKDLINHEDIQTKSMGFYELKHVKQPMEIFVITTPGLIIPTPDQLSGKGKLLDAQTTEKLSSSGAAVVEKVSDEQQQAMISAQEKSELAAKTSKRKKMWNFITSAAVIIGIIGSLAGTINIFTNNVTPMARMPTQLTVYVHGPKGQQDHVLENDGEIMIDFNGDRRTAQIGENGRTVFSEIPASFEGSTLPISVQATGYEATHPNKQYEWNNEAIYFQVRVEKKLLEIKGIVKNEDGSALLDNTRVIIENEFSTITDSLGRFNYQLEEHRLREKYTLSLQKEGYQPLTEYYYPKSSKEFRLKKQ